MRLSPLTCYYIRKLLYQPSSNTKATALTTPLTTKALSDLDQVLQSLYPSTKERSTAIQRLESLVYIHKNIHAQISLHTGYPHELIKLEQQILWLLGSKRLEPNQPTDA